MAWTLEGPAPTYCPWCGDRLESRIHEGASLPHCTACDRTLFRNPVPMARTTASVTTGELAAGSDAADARYWTREKLLEEPPSLRASGLGQVLSALDAAR